MDTNDWFMKQLQITPRKLPAIIQQSREPMLDVVDEETGEVRSVSLRQYLLELMLQLDLNKAENVLFDQLDKMSDSEIHEISDWFYAKLTTLSASELSQADFSLEEIEKGRVDIRNILTTSEER